MTQQTAKVSK